MYVCLVSAWIERTRESKKKKSPHHITPQPSASWKLSAMSVPFCSVHTISVSTSSQPRVPRRNRSKRAYPAASGIRPRARCESPAACDPAGPPTAPVSSAHPVHVSISFSFLYIKAKGTHVCYLAGAEARPPVEPVVVPQLVDLDSLAVVQRRHRERHGHGRCRRALPSVSLSRVCLPVSFCKCLSLAVMPAMLQVVSVGDAQNSASAGASAVRREGRLRRRIRKEKQEEKEKKKKSTAA